MNTFRLGWTATGLVGIAMVVATSALAVGDVIRVVTPSSASGAEGDASVTPPIDPVRNQWLYPAADFATVPATHHYIVGVNFRSDWTQTQPVDWSWPHEQIWLSTTSLNSLTTGFDANHGPDKKLVYDGPGFYRLLGTGNSAGPRDIADGLRLQLPFYYDPAKGNLLIEKKVIDHTYPIPATIDVVSGVPGRFLNGSNPNGPTCNVFPVVPVLQFEFDEVPEASTIALAGLAFIGLFARRSNSSVRGVSVV